MESSAKKARLDTFGAEMVYLNAEEDEKAEIWAAEAEDAVKAQVFAEMLAVAEALLELSM